jgi:hypothetical protein
MTAAEYRTTDGVLFVLAPGEPKHLARSAWDVADSKVRKTTLCGHVVSALGLSNYAGESSACPDCITKAGDNVRLRSGREPGQEG